jgi:peptide/nickel transport system permease protein
MRAGIFVLLLILGTCTLAPAFARFVAGTDPFRTNVLGTVGQEAVLAEAEGGLGTVPIGPGWRKAYALGADRLGRDVAARLLYGGRTSLLLAAGATVLCLGLGGLAGVVAGVCGGSIDAGVSGLVDLVWAFPVMLLAISLSIVWAGEDTGPLLPMAILGLVYTPYVARPVRAALVALRAAPFIEAARATGGSSLHIIGRHMLPQLAPLLLSLAPVVVAMTLMTEAALSVLGLGVTPPGVSWGTLIADGVGLMHQRPMVAVAPGLMLSATVLALNAVGEGLRAAG